MQKQIAYDILKHEKGVASLTLSKLAKLANVSISVASKAFSGKGEISDAMREHVFSVAKEHGCFQQFYHIPYDKPVVAIIVPEIISSYYVHYIQTLKVLLEKSGCSVLVSVGNFDGEHTKELIRYHTAYGKVSGLILVTDTDYDFPAETSTAIVRLHLCQDVGFGAYVGASKKRAVKESLALAMEMGHSKVGFVGEALTGAQRNTLMTALKECGLEVRDEWIHTSFERFEDAGREGVKSIFLLSERPTLLYGAYGCITRGIIDGLFKMGISVPSGVSVVSFDDEPSPLHPTLDVSRMGSGIDSICDIAVKLLLERMGKKAPNEFFQETVYTDFTLGGTLAPTNE